MEIEEEDNKKFMRNNPPWNISKQLCFNIFRMQISSSVCLEVLKEIEQFHVHPAISQTESFSTTRRFILPDNGSDIVTSDYSIVAAAPSRVHN